MEALLRIKGFGGENRARGGAGAPGGTAKPTGLLHRAHPGHGGTPRFGNDADHPEGRIAYLDRMERVRDSPIFRKKLLP